MYGRAISMTAATTKKFMKVPIPGFSFRGIQKSKTPKLTTIIERPIPISNSIANPWAKTIHGLTPKFEPNNIAWPNPKIDNPINKNKTDNKGGLIDNGVGALQNNSGTLFNENIFTMEFTYAN